MWGEARLVQINVYQGGFFMECALCISKSNLTIQLCHHHRFYLEFLRLGNVSLTNGKKLHETYRKWNKFNAFLMFIHPPLAEPFCAFMKRDFGWDPFPVIRRATRHSARGAKGKYFANFFWPPLKMSRDGGGARKNVYYTKPWKNYLTNSGYLRGKFLYLGAFFLFWGKFVRE